MSTHVTISRRPAQALMTVQGALRYHFTMKVLFTLTLLWSFAAWADDIAPKQWEFVNADALQSYNDGVRHLRDARPHDAEKEFRQALELDDSAGMGWYALALTVVNLNRPVEAVPILERISHYFPRTEVLVELSRAHFANGEFEDAEAAAFTAMMREPKSLDVHAALQWALLRQGKYDDALDVLVKARETGERAEWDCLEIQARVAKGEFENAKNLLPKCTTSTIPEMVNTAVRAVAQEGADIEVLASMGREDAGTLVARAVGHVRRGEEERALELLNNALQKHPYHFSARVIRGGINYSLGHLEQAKADLGVVFHGKAWIEVEQSGMLSGIVTKSDEEHLEGQLRHGAALLVLMYAENEQIVEGEEVLARALGRFGSYGELGAAEGRLLVAKGDIDGAWQKLGEVVKVEDTGFIRHIVGQIAFAHPGAMPDDVEQFISKSTDWTAHYALAAGLSNQNQNGQCMVAADRGLDASGADGLNDEQGRVVLLEVAYGCALNSNDLKKAKLYLHRLGLSNARPDYAMRHAAILANSGEYQLALELLDAIGPQPEMAAFQSTLRVSVHTALDQLDLALSHLHPEADPNVVSVLGYKLAAAKRGEEALDLLQKVCPAISGESQKHCTAVIDDLQK
ncbi:MAG: tetratricopeptide repeat protein [Proteobacteria bacterium]|nr:tetratricopeptide repeat protein [Pseudomonadota bacterium]